MFLFWDRSFTFGGQNLDAGIPRGYYEVNDRRITSRAGSKHSPSAVDQWSIGNRLTLDIGLRTENEVAPTFRPDILKNAIEFGFADKLAPRLGAARRVGRRSYEGLRQLGPLLRLDEARAAARLVRR